MSEEKFINPIFLVTESSSDRDEYCEYYFPKNEKRAAKALYYELLINNFPEVECKKCEYCFDQNDDREDIYSTNYASIDEQKENLKKALFKFEEIVKDIKELLKSYE